MLLNLLFAPLTAPMTGLAWIGEKILEQAEPEVNELEVLQKRLLALQLAFDMGDMPEEEFDVQEEELLLAIQALQDAEQAAVEE